jgi:hypothetical protein
MAAGRWALRNPRDRIERSRAVRMDQEESVSPRWWMAELVVVRLANDPQGVHSAVCSCARAPHLSISSPVEGHDELQPA